MKLKTGFFFFFSCFIYPICFPPSPSADKFNSVEGNVAFDFVAMFEGAGDVISGPLAGPADVTTGSQSESRDYFRCLFPPAIVEDIFERGGNES